MVIFVGIFGALLLANNLFAKINWTAPRMIGMVLVLVAIGLGVAKASLVTSGGSKNLSQLLANIIQFRILPDPERRQFFVEQGLPISSTVMERSGKAAWVNDDWYAPDNVLSDRPEFIAYRRWIETKGIRTYLTFLLAHPWYLLRSIVYNPTLSDEHYRVMQDVQFSITDLFSRPFTGGYQTFFTPYPKWLRNFLLAPFGWFIPLLYLVVVVIRYTWQTTTQQRASSRDLAAIAAAGAVFVNYHVDAWGIWPHSVPFILLIYIALITGTAEVAKGLVPLIQRFASARIGPIDSDTIGFKDPDGIPNIVSTSLSTGARLNTVWVVAVSIFCASVAWASHNYYFSAVQGSWQVASSTPGSSVARKATDISELRPVPKSSPGPGRWDLIEGLSAEVVQGSAMVSGWHTLQLVAAGANGRSDIRHALGARFGGLAAGGIYRAVAWVKAEPGVRVMIEARDSIDSHTGNASNYGLAQFDLAAHTVLNSAGDILASGVEAAADGWLKVWVDLRSRDGEMFALLGLLEGRNNRHVFIAAGQRVIFGGFEISPR